MKQIPCSYPQCGNKRTHWTNPEIQRDHRIIEVPDDSSVKYCSIECAMYDGYFKLIPPLKATQ